MINVGQFRKIWALTSSPNQHEADSALRKACTILAADGKTIDDVPGLLNDAPAFSAVSFEDVFGSKAVRRTQIAEKRKKVVERYGSEEAVTRPTVYEAKLDVAVKRFKKNVREKFFNGTFWVPSLNGWTNSLNGTEPPSVVVQAVKDAYALPETIQQAKAERDHWDQRSRDLHDFYGDQCGEDVLSLAAELRRDVVTRLFESGLRAACVPDVICRLRGIIEDEMHPSQQQLMALLADLEALA